MATTKVKTKVNAKTAKKLEAINADPARWFNNFVKINNNQNEYIPFILNEQQSHFLKNMDKYSIILKSRALGFTTFSLAYCLWSALNKPRTNYLVVSYKQDSATALFDKLKSFYGGLPHEKYNFPKDTQNNRLQMKFDNGSTITLAVAGNKDLGRGLNLQYVLLSEFAFYSNQEKLLLSIEQALAKNDTSKLVIETTANGFNYMQTLYSNASKGKSRYKTFFFPWFASAYKQQFKSDYDEAERWFKATYHKRLTPDWLDNDEQILLEMGANLRQLMWRQWKLSGGTSENSFKQEYPSNALEAFISTGQSVFDTSKIVNRLPYVTPPMSVQEIGASLPVSLKSYVSRKALNVFELPKQGMKYYAGCDVSSGSSKDSSTISILDETGKQVLSFYDNKVSIYKFASVINEIGHWYNYAFTTVERNGYGIPILERLRNKYQYMNLFKMKIFDQNSGRT
ncbi:terminase large subunit domain-containing protein [Carnobacterium viridans]|uniref:terminase large subunit domain-containing protein n=2 Tax=Carnobacterium viridans TaxID=174587 RepID=UPI000AE55A1F|nr:terminase family protein [Carnobacterium viridans]